MFSDEDLLKYLYNAYTEAKSTGDSIESFQEKILQGNFYESLVFSDTLSDKLSRQNFRDVFSEEQMRMISVIAHTEPKELDRIFSSVNKDAGDFYKKFDEVEQKALSSDNKNLMQQLLPDRASIKLNYAVFLANYTREIEGSEVIDASDKGYKNATLIYTKLGEISSPDREYFNNQFNIEAVVKENGALDASPNQRRTVLAERFFDSKVKKFFDFSNDQQIEELYTLDEKYKTSLSIIKNELLEKTTLQPYQDFAKQDFSYFQDNSEIIRNIFKQNQFNDNLDFSPEENHDLRLMDFIRKLHDSKEALWRIKDEHISLWDMIEILDPTKMDSPIKDYYQDMPTDVKEDIQEIFKFLKDKKEELSKKYQDFEITDQIYFIIKTNLEEKIKERRGSGLPEEYNGVPSGNRCITPECNEELRELLKNSKIFFSTDIDIIIQGFTNVTSDKNKNYTISAKTGEVRELS